MKNITFSADEELIEKARTFAVAENTTLNHKFREWLEAYTRESQADRSKTVRERVRSYVDSGDRKFTRDEMNRRG